MGRPEGAAAVAEVKGWWSALRRRRRLPKPQRSGGGRMRGALLPWNLARALHRAAGSPDEHRHGAL